MGDFSWEGRGTFSGPFKGKQYRSSGYRDSFVQTEGRRGGQTK